MQYVYDTIYLFSVNERSAHHDEDNWRRYDAYAEHEDALTGAKERFGESFSAMTMGIHFKIEPIVVHSSSPRLIQPHSVSGDELEVGMHLRRYDRKEMKFLIGTVTEKRHDEDEGEIIEVLATNGRIYTIAVSTFSDDRYTLMGFSYPT